MTLHTLTTLAISAHAAHVATRALASLPAPQARWIQRAGRAERNADARWVLLGKALREGCRI